MNERQEQELIDNDIEIIEDDKAEKCIVCPLNRVCIKAFECGGKKLTKGRLKTIECFYELHGQFDKKRKLFIKWQSFVDMDPKYFMEKMMVTYDILQEEALKDFSFAKGMQMLYLQMSIHKMKFGEKRQIENSSSVNASDNIKQLLNKIRDEKN